MRLLNTSTLELVDFVGKNVPPYAILSHTWDKDETTYSTMTTRINRTTRRKAGFIKIARFCEEAKKRGFSFGWADTCCIDKSSSSELSESINSMFQWYRRAELCIAYLADVPEHSPLKLYDKAPDDMAMIEKTDILNSAFGKSRWFTKGWTLQELIAPQVTIFMDQEWNGIGRISHYGREEQMSFPALKDLLSAVCVITNFHYRAFFIGKLIIGLSNFSVAQKMSWASKRTTTRPEDTAYCLMGLLGVNMPLIYGEGAYRAFLRLEMILMEQFNDETLFAFNGYGALAASPGCFWGYGDFVSKRPRVSNFFSDSPCFMTNKGLRMRVRLGVMDEDPYRLGSLDYVYPASWFLLKAGPKQRNTILAICVHEVFPDRYEKAEFEPFEINPDSLTDKELTERVIFIEQRRPIS